MTLSASEVQRLIAVLGVREPTLVLLAFGTGLRMSELFGLKWLDIDFQRFEISVTRSIVFQVVCPCKTEASQKPVPLDSRLAEALRVWRDHTKCSKPEDWVFASPAARGRRPYWGQCLMRTAIRPAAAKIGITHHIGVLLATVSNRNHDVPIRSHFREDLDDEPRPWLVFNANRFARLETA